MVENSNVINFANFPQVRDTVYKELILASLASSELNESIGSQNVEKYATQAVDIELACYEAAGRPQDLQPNPGRMRSQHGGRPAVWGYILH